MYIKECEIDQSLPRNINTIRSTEGGGKVEQGIPQNGTEHRNSKRSTKGIKSLCFRKI